MTPKRLRLIASIIRKSHNGESWKAIAEELDEHATELEQSQQKEIRLREPAPLPKASEGMR